MDPKEIEIYNLSDKRSKQLFWGSSLTCQKTERHFNRIRKMIYEQNSKIDRDIEIIKGTKQKIFMLKNTMTKIKEKEKQRVPTTDFIKQKKEFEM